MDLLRRDRALEAAVSFRAVGGRREWTDLDRKEIEKINKTNKHNGQYKLFLSDLLAFGMARAYMPDAARRIVVVVAGASPGQHWAHLIPILLASNMGDRITFELYDSEELCDEMQTLVRENDSIEFCQQLFTTETAKEIKQKYKDSYIVFLSDIRSSIHERAKHDAGDEKVIQENMRLQSDAVAIMLPVYSCLKFHAPHATPGHKEAYPSFKYLHGVLCLQAYTYALSAELRLHVTLDDITVEKLENQQLYDPVEIEQCAFHNNTIRRPCTHTDQNFEDNVWRATMSELGVDPGSVHQRRARVKECLHTHNEHNKHRENVGALHSLLSRMRAKPPRS